MGEITIDPKGVLILLNNQKLRKASGLSARVLRECSWRQANVAPVCKKGGKYDTANKTRVAYLHLLQNPGVYNSKQHKQAFIIFINDIPENIRSSIRLFADECVLYRNIKCPMDCQILQDDLKQSCIMGQRLKFNPGTSLTCEYNLTTHYINKNLNRLSLPNIFE